MCGLTVLLRHALDRDETHTRSTHRLADRFRVDAIVLVALDVRLHELGCDELDAKSPLLELAPPVMGRCASLHPYIRAWSEPVAQHLEPLAPLELRPPLRAIMTICRVNVKDGLCNVDPNSRNLHPGLLLTL
jgi:hypothetical protein